MNELTEKTGKLQQEEVQKKNAEQAVTQLKVIYFYLYHFINNVDIQFSDLNVYIGLRNGVGGLMGPVV